MKQLRNRLYKATEASRKNCFLTLQKIASERGEEDFHEFRDKFFNSPRGFSAFIASCEDEFDGTTENEWNEFALRKLEEFKNEL